MREDLANTCNFSQAIKAFQVQYNNIIHVHVVKLQVQRMFLMTQSRRDMVMVYDSIAD